MSGLDDLIAQAEAQHPGLPPGLLASLLYNGENSSPTAVSPKGAMGRAQLMPATAAELGVTDPTDDSQAIPAAARYLADNVKKFGVAGGVAAYNAGPGAVQAHGGVPPYPETQAYVRRVTGALDGSDIFAQDPHASAAGGEPPDGSDIFKSPVAADKPGDGADIFADPAGTKKASPYRYADTGEPLNDAQTAFYDAQSAKNGGIDINGEPGSRDLPYAMHAGTKPEPGKWYVGLDGKLQQEPDLATNPISGVFEGLGRSLKTLGGDYLDRQKDANSTLVDDVMHPNPAMSAVPFAREGKVALDAVNDVIGAPIGALTDQFTRPVETATGGRIPHKTASDVLDMFVPLAGEAGGARSVAKAADAAGMTANGLEGLQSTSAATRRLLSTVPVPVKPMGPIAQAVEPVVAGYSPRAVSDHAARLLARNAKDLPATRSALSADTPDLVPGSTPTTFQLTGDMGLGALERDARNRNPVEFQDRAADQNSARLQSLQSLQAGADPMDVVTAVKGHLGDIDAQTQAAVDKAMQGAQTQDVALGGTGTPEGYGEKLRGMLDLADQAARAHEDKLWHAVDPNGDLTGNVEQTLAEAAKIAGDVPSTAKPMSGEEAGIFEAAQAMKPLSPLRDLLALRSRVSTEMRNELVTAGRSSPAYGRLSQLRGAIQNNLSTTIAHEVVRDNTAVARGEIGPDDSLASRLEALIDGRPGQTDALAKQVASGGRYGSGIGQASGSGATAGGGPGGATGAAGRGPGGDPGNTGLPSDPELAAARADVESWRAPSPNSLFAAVKKAGGVRVRDASGRQIAGPDVVEALNDVRYPGLINNASGIPPERLAQGLADAGWFGPNVADPSLAFESALNREARGAKVFHPDDITTTQRDVRSRLENDLASAGVGASDTTTVAAQKLARYRRQRSGLGQIAEASGIPGAHEMQPDELLGDLQERAAIRAEGASAEADDPHGAEFDRLSRSVERPSIDDDGINRINLATANTRDRVRTFALGAPGAVLKKSGASDLFRMPDGQVAARIFHSGPTGFDDVDAAVKASPGALPVIQDYAASSLRRAAMDSASGVLDPAKFQRWRSAHQDAIRALPEEARRKFGNAALAGRAVADAGVARAAALKEAQSGMLGKVMGLADRSDLSKVVGGILNGRTAVTDMKKLAATVGDNEDAKAGLRQAIVDHIANTYVGNSEAATSGQSQIKADAFQSFVRQKRAALAEVFDPAEVANIEAVAADVHRAQRSHNAVRIPGQSNSVQDLYGSKKSGGGLIGGRSVLDLIGTGLGAAIGYHFGATGAAAGSMAGGTIAHMVQGLRASGIANVDALVTRAMLDPKLAATLLDTIPSHAPKMLVEVKIERAMKALAGAAAASGGAELPDDVSPKARSLLGSDQPARTPSSAAQRLLGAR